MDGGLLDMDTATNKKTALAFVPGDRVTYVNDNGLEYPAMVCRWWGGLAHSTCSLVYVASDGAVRIVDNVPRGDGSAPGRYWHPADEPATNPNSMCVSSEQSAIKNQPPPPVAGYRHLTAQDVGLVNEVKAVFDAVGNVLAMVRYPNGTPDTVDGLGFPADAEEALRHARHHAQTAAMWAVRAITRPTGFA